LPERPMREVHCEVIRPTQRSPCLGCRREDQPKDRCIENCERLRIYQAATADIIDKTHTHELVGERTAPVKQGAKRETPPAAKPREKKEQTPRAKEIQQAVRKVIDGYPAGHEFTFPDLVQDVSRLLGRTVTANVLGTYFYGSARPSEISCRQVRRKNKRIYRKECAPKPPADPVPAVTPAIPEASTKPAAEFDEIEIGENHLLLDLTHHPAMRSEIGRIAAVAEMKNEDVAIWLLAAGLVIGFSKDTAHEARIRGERGRP
jgi:hypothetical protein